MDQKEAPSLRPSIRVILWMDYASFLASVFPVAAWIILLAWVPDWRGQGPVIPRYLVGYAVLFNLALTLACLEVIGYRLKAIFWLYQSGVVVPGRVDSIRMKRDHGIVEVAYSVGKDRFTSRSQVHLSRKLKELKTGERVVLLVDREHPRKALIRDLYT